MKEFIKELLGKIIETLDIVDIDPEEIDENEPLVGGALGIDSIDVLELVVMIEKEYSVHIENKETGEKAFASLAALAGYILENRPKDK